MHDPNVSPVLDNILYQGSYMAPAYLRPPATLHVGCAHELRPSLASARHVLFFPLNDDPATDWASKPLWCAQVERVADICAEEVVAGGRVLVTCAMGLNRSGLVTAMTLCRLGFDAGQAIGMVRAARGPKALSNPQFVRVIEALG